MMEFVKKTTKPARVTDLWLRVHIQLPLLLLLGLSVLCGAKFIFVSEIIINLLCTTSAVLNVSRHAELGPGGTCCISWMRLLL